jgi:hypothetical protein
MTIQISRNPRSKTMKFLRAMTIRSVAATLLAASALSACGGGDGGSGPEMPKAEYDSLVVDAVGYLDERQDSIDSQYDFKKLQRAAWDQRTGKLTFVDSAGDTRVEAEIQMVGSLSKTKGTWMWAWANPSVRGPLKTGAQTVRRYGQQYRIRRLTTKEMPAKTDDAWKMTALSARVLNAQGAYHTEDEDGITYMVITSIGSPGETADSAFADTLADVAPVPAPKPKARPRPSRERRDSTAGAGWQPVQ